MIECEGDERWKEEKKHIKERMEKVPVPKAHGHKKHQITNRVLASALAVALMIFGMMCIFFTDKIHAVFRYILGINMAALGVCDLYRGITLEEFKKNDTKLTANGIVMLILGFVILFHNGNADSIIGSIWGMLGIFKGTEELNQAIYHYFSKEAFMGKAIHAVVELLLAIVLLVDPVIAVKHHVAILGVELVWYGLQIISDMRSLPSSQGPVEQVRQR